MKYTSSTIYIILEWITRFAFVNLLWILFTLLGGIIFGLYPSTIAMFTIIREWLKGKHDIPVFTSFWNFYKREFINSNKLGIMITFVMAIIGIDFSFIQSIQDESYLWLSIPLFSFMFLFLIYLFYLFPAFVHYDLKLFPLMKNAFLIMLIHPLHSLLMLVCLVSIYLMMSLAPALYFIFGASTYAFITMWLSYHAFQRVERKKIES